MILLFFGVGFSIAVAIAAQGGGGFFLALPICVLALPPIGKIVDEPLCDFGPQYDIDPQTGASVEIFYADRVLAKSFGRDTGWFWWSCQSGSLPGPAAGPFATSYAAYRDAVPAD